MLAIDSGETRSLATDPDLAVAAWLPDGDHLLCIGGGQKSGLWKTSTLDGTARQILKERVSIVDGEASADGSHIAFEKSNEIGFWVMGAEGENPHLVGHKPNAGNLGSFAWSPSGRRVAYGYGGQESHEGALETCNLEGEQCTTILSDKRLWTHDGGINLSWMPDGRIFFTLAELPPNQTDSNIWAVDVDPDTGRVRGKPARLTNWVGLNLSAFSHASNGKRLSFLKTRYRAFSKVAELDPGHGMRGSPRSLTVDGWNYFVEGWTRDSQAVLLGSLRNGRDSIFKQPLHGSNPEIVVSGSENYGDPVFSPDGNWLLYTASSGSLDYFSDPHNSRLMHMPVGGGPSSVLLLGRYSYDCAIPPSKTCMLGELRGTQVVWSSLDPAKGRGPEIVKVEARSAEWKWSLSPDGTAPATP